MAYGYDGSRFTGGAPVRFAADGDVPVGVVPTAIEFLTGTNTNGPGFGGWLMFNTTPLGTDDPAVSYRTTVLAIHLTQLRTAIDAVRREPDLTISNAVISK